MSKCKFCFSPLNEQDSICSVCKIDPKKDKKELSKEEKKIVHYCATINAVGFLAIIGGILGILISIFEFLSGGPKVNYLFVIANFIFAGLFVFFGLSLKKYAKWCYVGGIVLYSIAIVFGLIAGKIFSLLLGVLFLSYIAAPTSKKIFLRQL